MSTRVSPAVLDRRNLMIGLGLPWCDRVCGLPALAQDAVGAANRAEDCRSFFFRENHDGRICAVWPAW